jgi:hypothetical protein
LEKEAAGGDEARENGLQKDRLLVSTTCDFESKHREIEKSQVGRVRLDESSCRESGKDGSRGDGLFLIDMNLGKS